MVAAAVSSVKVIGGPDGGGNSIGDNIADATSKLAQFYGVTTSSHSSTRFVFDNGSGGVITLTGADFADFDSYGVPHTGTITGLRVVNGGVLDSNWQTMSLAAQTFVDVITAAHNGDQTAPVTFLNDIFSGNDQFYGHGAATGSGDNFFGLDGNDTFHMEDSGLGPDLQGGNGDDTFMFGAAFDPRYGTHVDGGAGNDTLTLDGGGTSVYFGTPAFVPNPFPPLPGAVAHGIDLNPDSITNIEMIKLKAGSSYGLIFDNSNVAPGDVLTISASMLSASNSIYINGVNLTGGGALNVTGGDGNDVLIGGFGNDVFKGGDGNNLFDLRAGGNDTATGGSGNDVFNLGPTFTTDDKITGGDGVDTVYINGNYASGVVFNSTTMRGIETLNLGGGGGPSHSYNLTFANATVAAGATLTVNAGLPNSLAPTDTVTLDGHLVAMGALVFHGHQGADTFIGGKGADQMDGGAGGTDQFTGGGGADQLHGSVGSDTFIYKYASDSTGGTFDTIFNFDPAHDHIKLPQAITGIDLAVTHGALHAASMDADLATALGSSALHGHHAVLFTPDSGDLAGHTFLIIDPMGMNGYSAGYDYVIQLTTPISTSLATADFIV